MSEEELHRLRRPLVEAGMDLATADGRAGLGALLRELGRPALPTRFAAQEPGTPPVRPERPIPR